MSDEKKVPSELEDDARQGVTLRRVGPNEYVPVRGFTPCAKCKEIKPRLFGIPGAAVCNVCAGGILAEWGKQHIAAERKALRLDPEPSPDEPPL